MGRTREAEEQAKGRQIPDNQQGNKYSKKKKKKK